MLDTTEAALVLFLEAGTRYFNIHAGVKVPAPKKSHKKKVAGVPVPDPAPEPEAAPAPAPVVPEPPAAAPRVISLDEAKAIAREYIQRFQKADPDGMARIRLILKGKFAVEALSALTPEKLAEFVGVLEVEMAGEPK